MTIVQLRDRLIDEGIASVQQDDRMKLHQIEGSKAGFELCRSLLTPQEYETVLMHRHKEEGKLVCEQVDKVTYWRYRYATIQVEFIYERMKVFYGIYPMSARAILHVEDLATKEAQNATNNN